MKRVVAAVLFFCPATASAFECTNNPTGPTPAWVARCIPYTIEANDERFDEPAERAAVAAAFRMWSAPICTDLRFIDQGYALARVEGIHVETGPTTGPGTVAVTSLVFKTDTGEVLAGRITIAPEANIGVVDDTCVDTFDLTNVIAHEVGHVLGFADDAVGDSILTPRHAVCAARWSAIASGDLTGLCSVYPANTPVQTCVPPADGYGDEDRRLKCDDIVGAAGSPCKGEQDCGPGLGCDAREGTCSLDLSSRGCACSAAGTHQTSGGWLVFLGAIMLAAGWRRVNSR